MVSTCALLLRARSSREALVLNAPCDRPISFHRLLITSLMHEIGTPRAASVSYEALFQQRSFRGKKMLQVCFMQRVHRLEKGSIKLSR